MPTRAFFLSARADSRTRKDVSSFVLDTRNLAIKQNAKDDQSRPLIVGNRVFDVLPTTEDLIHFTRPNYLLLQLIWRGLSVEDAASKAGVDLEVAKAFLSSEKALDYLRKKELASVIAEETRNPDRWWVEVHNVMDGTKVLNKGQMVALQAQGDRVAPKRNDSDADKPKVTIQFNFSSESVSEAFRRQEAINAEIVEEQNGH